MAYQVRQFINHRCIMVYSSVLGVGMPLILPFNHLKPSGTGVALYEKIDVKGVRFDDLTPLQGNQSVSAPMVGE